MRIWHAMMGAVLIATGAWAQVEEGTGARRPALRDWVATRLGSQPGTAPASTRGTLPAATRPLTLPAGMRKIDTPYYTLWTDVTDQEAREVDLRLTRIFEEYQRRTAGFAGQVREKLPFYLFRTQTDYIAAGGPAKSGGVYLEWRDGTKRLMTYAGEKADDATWRVVQHEGFHQFASAAIKYDLPPWVNEGLAVYFGEGQWTGDGFVTGLIPQHLLERVRTGIRGGFKPFKTLMNLTQEEWSKDLAKTNYDQSWSMVHFLANADNGKYQAAFLQYMTAVSKGTPGTVAWEASFGKDVDAFQQRYAQWWASLPDRPTQLGFYRMMMQTETSFLARAVLLKQSFPNALAFVQRYQPPDFVASRDLWLPPALFTDYRDIAPDLGRWSFQGQRLVLEMPDGMTLVGSFTTANGKVTNVTVEVVPPPAGRGR